MNVLLPSSPQHNGEDDNVTVRIPTAVTGIKPTGTPHVGNYLGMIRPALELARDHRAFYFIADLHALTTVKDAEAVRTLTYEAAATVARARGRIIGRRPVPPVRPPGCV